LHQKKVTVHFRSYTQIGGPCDCGVPVAGMQGGGPLGQQQLTRRQLAKLTPEQRARQAAASKAFEAEAKRAARAAELGKKRHVPRCRCQGTLQRKIFDKYVDPLDGMIRVRQLERVLKEMHEEDLLARADEQERATGKRPKKNSHFWKPFDFQDAREAEGHLGMLVNGQDAGSDDDTDDDEAEGGGAEAQKLGKHLTGDGGVDYVMFEDWKIKYEEEKKSRESLGAAPDEEEEEESDEEGEEGGDKEIKAEAE